MIDKATSLRLLLHRNANLIQVFITHEIILFSLLSSSPDVITAYTSQQLYFLLCRHAPIVFGVCRCGLRSVVIIVVQIGCIERQIIRRVAQLIRCLLRLLMMHGRVLEFRRRSII